MVIGASAGARRSGSYGIREKRSWRARSRADHRAAGTRRLHMMVTAWRIVATRFASGAFSGEAARAEGGRWNSPGVRMVYTAGTISLALLELLIHLNTGDPI